MVSSEITVESLRTLLDIITPILSLILSALLLYLYKQQAKILDRQTKLTESEQRALPRVRMYHLTSWRDWLAYQAEDEGVPISPAFPDRFAGSIAYISNSGKGSAEDLRAELVVSTSERKYSCTSPLAHKTNMDQIAFNDKGGVLAPEEDEIMMQSWFRYSTDDIPVELEELDISLDDPVSPSELLWALHDIGETNVTVSIFIHYKDGTGSHESIQLLTSESELPRYGDINEVHRGGQIVMDEEVSPIFNYDLES